DVRPNILLASQSADTKSRIHQNVFKTVSGPLPLRKRMLGERPERRLRKLSTLSPQRVQLRLELSDGTELKLTSKHFIYRTECAVEKEQVTADGISREAVLAEKVVEGDCLYEVVDGKHMRTTRVAKVSTVTETGIYSPMTSNGKYADRLRKLYASLFGTKSD
ncbi:hypothetical protein COOONC_16883, partial [Cooperia oncophora]